MQIDTSTLITYSTVLMVVTGGLFVLFWWRETRTRAALWFGLPFLMGAVGAACLIDTHAGPSSPNLKIGAWFVLMAYGFGWQAVRVFYGRKPLPVYVIGSTLLWLVLAMTVIDEWRLFVLSAVIRGVLVTAFNGLSAFEFWRNRDEQLPSQKILFWIFAVYCAFDTVRTFLVSIIPLPLGALPAETWAIVMFNLMAMTLALSVTVFMIALSRERVSKANYQLALRDAMTGVYNRRAYFDHMDRLGQMQDGAQTGHALLVFDIDQFKSINDRFGHETGDMIIIRAAEAAQSVLRKNDKLYRFGGDEFVCVLPDTSFDEAFAAAERIRRTFRQLARDTGQQALDATISAGIAISRHAETPDHTFARADKALYAAKQTGRNRIIMAPETIPA